MDCVTQQVSTNIDYISIMPAAVNGSLGYTAIYGAATYRALVGLAHSCRLGFSWVGSVTMRRSAYVGRPRGWQAHTFQALAYLHFFFTGGGYILQRAGLHESCARPRLPGALRQRHNQERSDRWLLQERAGHARRGRGRVPHRHRPQAQAAAECAVPLFLPACMWSVNAAMEPILR